MPLPSKAWKPSHLRNGPVALSWMTGVMTLALQSLLTDTAQLDRDAAALAHFLCAPLPATDFLLQDTSAQRLLLYVGLWAFSVSNAFFVIPSTFPADGSDEPIKIPYRRPNMKQHRLSGVDYSYVVLNSLCMPGLFYHFICIMRSWGLDFGAPPLFGIYPASVNELVTQCLPEAAVTTALYFVVYEFVYYHWHRAMHEVPTLYTWVHKHHHQQTYPDRPAIDTLNTACLESQLGLYMQLAVLYLGDQLFGIANLPAGIWFVVTTAYLRSVCYARHTRVTHTHHTHVT